MFSYELIFKKVTTQVGQMLFEQMGVGKNESCVEVPILKMPTLKVAQTDAYSNSWLTNITDIVIIVIVIGCSIINV